MRVWSGLSGTEVYTFGGVSSSAVEAVAFGDYDADGRDDLFVWEGLADSRFQVRSGRTGAILDAFDTSNLFIPSGTSRPLGAIGDINGDGIFDVLIGDWGNDRALAFSFTCGEKPVKYGVGCAASPFGVDPQISFDGCFTPGATIRFQGWAGIVQPMTFLLLTGPSAASLPVGPGCDILVGAPWWALPLPTEANGTFDLELKTIGGMPTGEVFIQALFPDPGQPHGFAATSGTKLTFE